MSTAGGEPGLPKASHAGGWARRRRHELLLLLTALAFASGFVRARQRPLPSPFRAPAARSADARGVDAGNGGEAAFRTGFASRRHDVTAHAASLVELGDGRLRAFWFSGSDEGDRDVEILSATFDPERGAWSEASSVADPESTKRALWRHVTKLGNPAAARAADGTLWLFYVTASVGGWGGSTVSWIRSTDEGETWSPPRRLITTPLLNLNTMVRGAPFEYADGTLGVPAYQSLVRGFSEVLRVDRSGAVVDKQRVSTLGQGSQPLVLPTGASEALALMRPSGPPPLRVLISRTRDAGGRWTSPARTSLVNPNAGLAGLALPGGRVLVALNDVPVERDALSLVASGDGGRSWTALFRLEEQVADRVRPPDDVRYARTVAELALATDGSITDVGRYVASSRRFMCWEPRCHFEFSYPVLIRTARGEFHLLYTWNRAYIKHVRFNQAWLDERLANASNATTD
ncbi:MAG TPA: sialidase family protein [Vicinamibacteria bacterium]|nr:sialidase family protein [Vicinamibacteria bacterium]